MTISTTTSSVTLTGNGANTTWNYSFLIPAAADVQVSTLVSGVTTIIDPSLYAITTGSPDGGTVTYPLSGTPLAAGGKITIERVLPLTQTTSLTNQGNFDPASVESALDYLTMLVQDLNSSMINLDAAAIEAAATSVTQAVAQFNNEYLGSHTTDPTGTAAGQLYFNTTTNQMKAFNGATWQVTYNPSTAGVDSFNARTGVVVSATGDYSIGQISGASTVAATGKFADLISRPPSGQCRLVFTSTTSLTLQPFGGTKITINGAVFSIPAAGISISNAGLAASTVYYAYVKDSGDGLTPALELSTTGHSTNTDGVEIKTGDATRSLVGMISTNGSSQFQANAAGGQQSSGLIAILNWFNRRPISIMHGNSVTVNTASTTLTNISNTTLNILTWGDLFTVASAICTASTGGNGALMRITVDAGANVGSLGEFAPGTANYPGTISSVFASQSLTEGAHTVQLYGESSGGPTVTFYATNTTMNALVFG